MRRIVAAVAGVLVAGWTVPALAAVNVFVKSFATSPQNVVYQAGTKVDLQCEWGWNISGLLMTSGPGSLVIRAVKPEAKELVKQPLKPVANGTGSSTVKVPWEPKGPGSYAFECKVEFADATQLYTLKETAGTADNSRSLAVSVGGTYFPSSVEEVRKCQPTVGVLLDLDAAKLAESGELVFKSGKGKGTLSLFKSQAAPNSVQCAYGFQGGDNVVMYAFTCASPKKHPDEAHAFICKK